MRYEFYSKTNQFLIDGLTVGLSFFLAYHIRFDPELDPAHEFQMWVLLLPMIAGRLATIAVFGINRRQWRYTSLIDAVHIVRAYTPFSVLLVALRLGLPSQWLLLRIPLSVIAIEFLLSLHGALGVRMLRRLLYERRSHWAWGKTVRRVVLVGAGTLGATVAKEMALRPGIMVVGFLDDDPQKSGNVIAGVRVLGPTADLPEIIKTEKVDEVLICIPPTARDRWGHLWRTIDSLAVRKRFVPTIDEILDATASVPVSLGPSPAKTADGNSPPAAQIVSAARPSSSIQNKNIVITGGGGFLASCLAERLAPANRLVLFDQSFKDRPITFTSLLKDPNVRAVEGSVLDAAKLCPLLGEVNIVIHAAAIVGVSKVCASARDTLETNYLGTSHVLQALDSARQLERFVYFSTSEVFGVNSFRVNENTLPSVGPATEARWSYAMAKLAGEHLVKSYYRETGMPVVIVRPFNIFGPKRTGDHAILSFVLSALGGIPLQVHGDGSQIRSWCYVEDFCDAFVEMLGRPEAVGEDFNIGNPANTLTILQLAQKVIELTGTSASVVFAATGIPDVTIRVPSLDKAQKILGYQPRYCIDEGLKLTIDWYRSHWDYFSKLLPRAEATG